MSENVKGTGFMKRRRYTGARSCLGKRIGCFNQKTWWHAAGRALDDYEKAEKDIQEHLNTVFHGIFSSSVYFCPFMIGRCEDTARPKIVFFCAVKEPRILAQRVIDSSGLMRRLPGYRTKHAAKQPGIGVLCQPGIENDQDSGHSSVAPATDVYYNSSDDITAIAMPIFVKHSNGIVRKATANAVFDGEECFLLSVSHVFYDSTLGTHVKRDGDNAYSSGSDKESVSSSEDAPYDQFDYQSSEKTIPWSSDQSVTDESYNLRDEVATLRLEEESIDDPPLIIPPVPPFESLKLLGSMMIARSSVDQDWALIRMTDGDVAAGIRKDALDNRSSKVGVSQSWNGQVDVLTSHGPLRGSLSKHQTHMRLPNSATFQTVYHIGLNTPLQWGDCGAGAFDNAQEKKLYGHVVASSDTGRVVYIIPAHQIFVAASVRWMPRPSPTSGILAHHLANKTHPGDSSDIFNLRQGSFVLWAPGVSLPPSLVIGELSPDAPDQLRHERTYELTQEGAKDLWRIKAGSLGLDNGLYHYWFKIDDTSPNKFGSMLVTDPFAYSVDYRITKCPGNESANSKWRQPAAVIRLQGGCLLSCDPSGVEFKPGHVPQLSKLPSNSQLIIYELPASWSRAGIEPSHAHERDVGSFRDVLALLDKETPGGNFSSVSEVSDGAHLLELGINALELLPPADSKVRREWGYATANYFAPDYDLGLSAKYDASKPLEDLVALVDACHNNGIRFITDIVMAFGHDPYIHIAYNQFHIIPEAEPENSDAYQSNRDNELREGWGGENWRYIHSVKTYNPSTGYTESFCPSWEFHRTQLRHWMSDFHVDGLRLDSVNNIGNWDFIRTFSKDARDLFRKRYKSSGDDPDGRFLVIAEELAVPLDMIKTGTIDALWNETFQGLLRASILGQSIDNATNFEWTVRKMIDCRNLGFTDGSQAVNYITSHDVAGYRKERLYNFLQNNLVYEKEQRTKLAFTCLLTAVGIPMIFAGEEFCDESDRHDLEENSGQEKQIDPVNFARKHESWRKRVFDCTSRLVALRKRSKALGVNDTNFIHMDFDHGRRIMAWVRGNPDKQDLVVTVANFSAESTPGNKYVIRNWPSTPEGKAWREVVENHSIPADRVGREPLCPWDAKVYEMY
jgi:1,4-alpha-glucan branching enzyme